jgi:tetratricopeptide (TPR) repeat protein
MEAWPGRLDEAILEGRLALELEPLSIRYSRFLGDYLYYARQYDEAVRQYQEMLELGPNNPWVYEALGDAFERQGKHDEAIAAWRAALRFSGDEELTAKLDRAFTTGGFAGVLRAMGQEKLQRLEERRGRGEYVSAIEHARAYVRCADDEQAFRWLEVASGELNNSPLMIKSDPLFDGLRADPRFASILNSIHLA